MKLTLQLAFIYCRVIRQISLLFPEQGCAASLEVGQLALFSICHDSQSGHLQNSLQEATCLSQNLPTFSQEWTETLIPLVVCHTHKPTALKSIHIQLTPGSCAAYA